MMTNEQQIAKQLVEELGLTLEVAAKAVSIVRRLDLRRDASTIIAPSPSSEDDEETISTAVTSTITSTTSPNPTTNDEQQLEEEEASLLLSSGPSSCRRSRATNRQKRKRGHNGVTSSSDDEDENEKDENEEEQSTTITLSPSTGPSSSVHPNRRSSTSSRSNSKSTTTITSLPTTKSGKQQFRRDLIQLLKEHGQAISIQDAVDHFGWDPTIALSSNHCGIEPSLKDYAHCSENGLIIALPSEEHWAELNRKMRSSKKIQECLGRDEKKAWRTYRFLDTEDYHNFVDSFFDAKEGLFPLPQHIDREMKLMHLSHWITNNNGRYWLDEKPAFKLTPPPKKILLQQQQSKKKSSFSGLTRQQLEQAQAKHDEENEDLDEEEEDDEIDSIPSKISSSASSDNTVSSTNTVPLIPVIPDEEFEEVTEGATEMKKVEVPCAPPVPQYGGKSGHPCFAYKCPRSATGPIIGSKGKSTNGNSSSVKKKVSFDLESTKTKAPVSTIASRRKAAQDDDDHVPAWVTAPLRFADC